jgi:hypothetical protein
MQVPGFGAPLSEQEI